jgi:hypothetical protein
MEDGTPFSASVCRECGRAISVFFGIAAMSIDMSWLVFVAGILQLSVLVASSLVPFQLDWRKELASLPKLHRQLYFVYGG